jgi:hypothetical protein
LTAGNGFERLRHREGCWPLDRIPLRLHLQWACLSAYGVAVGAAGYAPQTLGREVVIDPLILGWRGLKRSCACQGRGGGVLRRRAPRHAIWHCGVRGGGSGWRRGLRSRPLVVRGSAPRHALRVRVGRRVGRNRIGNAGCWPRARDRGMSRTPGGRVAAIYGRC